MTYVTKQLIESWSMLYSRHTQELTKPVYEGLGNPSEVSVVLTGL